MITAKNLCLQYKDGVYGIKDSSLVISKGELVFITGTSGSGKTSFVKMILGIEKPTAGSLHVLGYDMNSVSSKQLQLLRQKIGPVFQDFKLLDAHTACENVLTGLRFLDLTREEMYSNSLEALEKVGLSHKVHDLVDTLSYGERQRVAIARAVARRPQLIIADEPTGNLDRETSIQVLTLLKTLVTSETSVIVTTHATHLLKEEIGYKSIVVSDGTMTVRDI
ncbi:MAG: ATP-binding cassette domain-containing protein [Gudongella sp.]|jgi:cell division transport system ATP-binding protein|nr:ATP-binding cassette domain-containing protein [Gudongella sp.]